MDAAANLAAFLQERTGSVCGRWAGRMPAKEQRALFGRFVGKGRLVIDGGDETIRHLRIVCFGHDWDETFFAKWRDL